MMNTLRILTAASLALAMATTMAAETTMPRTTSPEGARVYFIAPQDSDEVATTFTVRFGLEGMGVAPAGVDKEHTGHHHLLVDVDPPADLSMPMSKDVKHFGGGQTETTLTLEPGTHTLQLLLGDRNHVPHDPPVISEKITVNVVPR
jgi:hypothetical protein